MRSTGQRGRLSPRGSGCGSGTKKTGGTPVFHPVIYFLSSDLVTTATTAATEATTASAAGATTAAASAAATAGTTTASTVSATIWAAIRTMFRASITASFRPAGSGYWSIAVEVRLVIGKIAAAFNGQRWCMDCFTTAVAAAALGR
jgi:hypothetical protein